ncbi:hypothetical protein C8R44DRAFT_820126 [Mycena epipterygia]|nr:hypothetical protein C8R44DRAFT_820126 [Mycena epipterygia]
MSSSYTLTVQSVEGISWKPGLLRRQNPKFYVVVYLDGIEIHRTHAVKGGPAPKWDSICPISADSSSSTISLQLLHSSRLRDDMCVGVAETRIYALAVLYGSGDDAKDMKLQLMGLKGELTGRTVGTLSVCLMDPRPSSLFDSDVASNVATVFDSDGGSEGDVATWGATLIMSRSIESALQSVISKLEILVSIGDQIATIHPYANIAWKILTSVHKVVKQKMNAKLYELVQTIDEVYSFVDGIDSLPEKIERAENKVLAIVKQTAECALFIQEYVAHGFIDHAVWSAASDTYQKIDELSTALRHLKNPFEGGLTVQSLFLSTKVLDAVVFLDESDTLKKLNPVPMNSTSRDPCLVGTRREILDDITEWFTVPSDSGNILWLSGVAGSGKSTISLTIAESTRGLQRLGAVLFFNRNEPSCNHPSAVIRTIAYWLALSDTHVEQDICATIRRDPEIINAPLQMQFNQLLLAPLRAAEPHISGPILIILDALDECGDPFSRRALLSLLSDEFPKLPHFIRILITSQRNSDITPGFRSCFTERDLDTVPSTAKDVEIFIRHEMAQMRKLKGLDSTWPEEQKIQAVVNLSRGLFIRASTAIRFLRANGYRPDEQLDVLIEHGLSGTSVLPEDPDPEKKEDLPTTADLPEDFDSKKKGKSGATTVFPENIVLRWKEAALLLLPSHFSTPNLLTTSLSSNFLRNIAHLTVARSLEDSTSDSDYKRVQNEVHKEWLKVGGVLVALAALETAAFALAPGSIFPIDKVARIAVSGSSISTGAGLLCNIYLLLRFSLASPPVFKHRTQDKYERPFSWTWRVKYRPPWY